MNEPVQAVGIFDENIDKLEQAMRIEAMKQAITAQNIANAKTPGYIAKTFDHELMQAVDRLDRKDVVLEEELADLAKNKYSTYSKMIISKFGVLHTIASQGRR